MKTFAATASAILFSVGAVASASAADLGGGMKEPVPYYAPPVSVFTWTGFYAGLQTGYAWGTADHTYSNGSSGSSDPEGWIGGGYGGYNWQSGNLVLGFEADIEGGNISGTFSDGAGTFGSSDLNWQGSLRGRIGIAADRTLFYMTGGWAFGDADVSGSTPILVAPFIASGSTSADLSGWTLGGGMEYAVTNNFTVRAEYRYTDFGDVTANFDNFSVNMPVDVQTSAIRVGAGWKF